MEDETIMSNDNTIQFDQMVVHPHLIVLYPQNQFAQIPLERGTIVLGRGQDADIRFEDELVSRRHCALSFDGGSVTVEDLGSTNGTFVDGNFVHKQILDSDNRLQMSNIERNHLVDIRRSIVLQLGSHGLGLERIWKTTDAVPVDSHRFAVCDSDRTLDGDFDSLRVTANLDDKIVLTARKYGLEFIFVNNRSIRFRNIDERKRR